MKIKFSVKNIYHLCFNRFKIQIGRLTINKCGSTAWLYVFKTFVRVNATVNKPVLEVRSQEPR